MAVITVYGKTPDVGSAAFVAPNATLAGDVVLAAGSSVWYGAVVRGDTGAIRIGKNSNIQDNAVLHTGPNLGGNDRQKCIHRPQCSGAWLYGGGRRFDRYARHGLSLIHI